MVDGVEFEQGEPTLFACPACYQELELWRWDEHCDQQDESDVLAPTLQALALLAGAVTLIHALGVWARS
ncbi:hypothetical protein CDL16_17650 [Pseudomonas aeruginosa]|nr:hypothetical protein CDL16_17650 [Pseudomonas aeruginosa]